MERVRITKKTNGFQKGHNFSKGRPPGSLNKITVLLKDGIIEAAERRGDPRLCNDPESDDFVPEADRGGLLGYLTYLLEEEPKIYGMLMGRVLPYHITHSGKVAHEHKVMRTAEAIKAELKERGLPSSSIYGVGTDEDMDEDAPLH